MKYLIYSISLIAFFACSEDPEFPVTYRHEGRAFENPRKYVRDDDGVREIDVEDQDLASFVDLFNDDLDNINLFKELVLTITNDAEGDLSFPDIDNGGVQSASFNYERLTNPDRIVINEEIGFTDWGLNGDCVTLSFWGAVESKLINGQLQAIYGFDYLPEIADDDTYLDTRFVGDTIFLVDVVERFCPE